MKISDIKKYDVVAHKDSPHVGLMVIEVLVDTRKARVISEVEITLRYTASDLIPYVPKPEPREIWVALRPDGSIIGGGHNEGTSFYGIKAIKCREVLDE